MSGGRARSAHGMHYKSAKQIMSAFSIGENSRQERLLCIANELKNNDVSEELIFLLCSFLPEANVSGEKRATLIEQAKKEFC